MLKSYQSIPRKLLTLSKNCPSIQGKSLFFHIITTGHYWRNSYIKELQYAVLSEEEKPQICSCICHSEEEEYEILELLSLLISESDTLVGYNSTSFHIPYLTGKYKAYGLLNPINKCIHLDLMNTCKKTADFFGISLKLENLRLLFNINDNEPELLVILETLKVLQYNHIFSGEFNVISFTYETDAIYITAEPTEDLLLHLQLNHDLFYFTAEKNTLKIMLRLFENRLKVYYKNYKDYYYFPDEDMIIHKSMISGISKDRLQKAAPENCYQYVTLPESISCAYLEKYLKMLFRQLIS